MDFLDEEDTRPRIVFRSVSSQPISSQLRKPDDVHLKKSHLLLAVAIALLLLLFTISYIETEPSKSILLWVALSLVIGPFAPSRITGGSIWVGEGSTLDPLEEACTQDEQPAENPIEKRGPRRRSRPGKANEIESAINFIEPVEDTGSISTVNVERIDHLDGPGAQPVTADVHDTTWNENDLVLLKKQMSKNPAGKPGRWEAVALAFNERYTVENVIKKAKELGELKSDDNGDYERFLKNRKAVDSRVRVENDEHGEVGWSSAEDVALLNALKAFPKDTSMRWEKIAATIPGHSKSACMKRFAELKKNFRDSKSNTNFPILSN